MSTEPLKRLADELSEPMTREEAIRRLEFALEVSKAGGSSRMRAVHQVAIAALKREGELRTLLEELADHCVYRVTAYREDPRWDCTSCYESSEAGWDQIFHASDCKLQAARKYLESMSKPHEPQQEQADGATES